MRQGEWHQHHSEAVCALEEENCLDEYLRNHQHLNVDLCIISDLGWYQHHSNPVIWKSSIWYQDQSSAFVVV